MSTAPLTCTRSKEQSYAWLNRQKKAPLSTIQVAALDTVSSDWRETLNGVWFTKLEAVEAFFAVHGFFPRAGVKDRTEKALGVWIASQRYRVDLLSADRIKLLDERLPGWNERSYEAKWMRHLDALESFVETHGRFPTQHEKNREDRRLGVWLNSRRQEGDSLPASRRNELDRRVPGWAMTAEKKWMLSLEFAIAYVAEHGKLPSESSADPALASSARWVGSQRRASFVPAHREALLDARLPIWREGMDGKWEAMLDYVVRFKAEHGRLPSKAATADSQEYRASSWMVRQRNGIGVTPQREARLDARIPGWRETTEDGWFRKLAAFEAFYKKHGRRPRQAALEPAERSLGVWYSNTIALGLSGDRAAALAAADIGDRRSLDEVWSDTLELVSDFYAAHGRLPALSGKEPGERTLATWVANQRATRERMSPERRGIMATRFPGWDLTLEDIWKLKLQQCVEFYQLHGRLPSAAKSAPEEEQKSGVWIVDQRKPKNSHKVDRIAMLDERLPGWRG